MEVSDSVDELETTYEEDFAHVWEEEIDVYETMVNVGDQVGFLSPFGEMS